MSKNESESENDEIAVELTRRYLSIQKKVARVRKLLVELVQECIEFNVVFESVLQCNTSRVGWWIKKHAPAIDHAIVKKLSSLAGRTHNPELIQSWQLRLLGLVNPVHHADKPKVKRRQQRRHKEKSWVYHLSKGQEALSKQIDRMGGMGKLTEEQREQMVEQFGSFADTLIKLKGRRGGV